MAKKRRKGPFARRFLLAPGIFYQAARVYVAAIKGVRFGLWRARKAGVREREVEDPFRGLRAGPASFSLSFRLHLPPAAP